MKKILLLLIMSFFLFGNAQAEELECRTIRSDLYSGPYSTYAKKIDSLFLNLINKDDLTKQKYYSNISTKTEDYLKRIDKNKQKNTYNLIAYINCSNEQILGNYRVSFHTKWDSQKLSTKTLFKDLWNNVTVQQDSLNTYLMYWTKVIYIKPFEDYIIHDRDVRKTLDAQKREELWNSFSFVKKVWKYHIVRQWLWEISKNLIIDTSSQTVVHNQNWHIMQSELGSNWLYLLYSGEKTNNWWLILINEQWTRYLQWNNGQFLNYIDFELLFNSQVKLNYKLDFNNESKIKYFLFDLGDWNITNLKPNNSEVVRSTINNISEFDWFPDPKDLIVSFGQKSLQMPENNNNSYIYFEDHYNGGKYNISENHFLLKWKIINNVEKIEIIWDGDMESFFLQKYTAWSWEFEYHMDEKYTSLKEWKNRYLIRWYAKDKIYERVITVFYTNFSEIKTLEKTTQDFSRQWDYKTNPTYKIEKETNDTIQYTMWLNIGSSIFKTEKYNITFINDVNNTYWNYKWNKIIISDKMGQELGIINNMSFTISEMSNPTIKMYKKTWDILFSMWWHEAPVNYQLFHKKTWKIISVFDVIKNYSSIKNYFVDVEITPTRLILRSIWNPWSETNESYILIMNLSTQELLSYEILESKLIKDYWKWYTLKDDGSTKKLLLDWKIIKTFSSKSMISQFEVWKSWTYFLIKYFSSDWKLLWTNLYNYWKWIIFSKSWKSISKFELLMNKEMKIFFSDWSSEILKVK